MIILIIINIQEWLHLILLKHLILYATKTILIKLDHYGIRGTAFKLIQSYLNNRLHYVHISNIEYNRKSVIMGVPQGSVLGPLLSTSMAYKII